MMTYTGRLHPEGVSCQASAGTAEPGGLGGLYSPTFEEDDIFFVFVLVYGTYKEIKKENKKTKVFSSGFKLNNLQDIAVST